MYRIFVYEHSSDCLTLSFVNSDYVHNTGIWILVAFHSGDSRGTFWSQFQNGFILPEYVTPGMAMLAGLSAIFNSSGIHRNLLEWLESSWNLWGMVKTSISGWQQNQRWFEAIYSVWIAKGREILSLAVDTSGGTATRISTGTRWLVPTVASCVFLRNHNRTHNTNLKSITNMVLDIFQCLV